uniref:3'-5' exonuclease domain-containing protein n=1 Tax=Strongyloides venezuelensis TaxID=75913 RepID=A0A0K0FUQ5_STRVS
METQQEISHSGTKLLQNINAQKFFNKKHPEYANQFSFELYKNVSSKNQFLNHVNHYFDYIKNLNNENNSLGNVSKSRFNGSKVTSNQKLLRKIIVQGFYLFYDMNKAEKNKNLVLPKKKPSFKKNKINFSLEISDHITILEIICLKAHDDKNSLIKLHMSNFELLKSREHLCSEIYNFINSGKYYFQILNFMLTDKGNFPFVNSPKLFEKLAFLGPIHAKSLEEIVDSKDETFFEDTVKVLKQLRCYMENFDLFEDFYTNTIRRKVKPEYFNIFRENVKNLFTRLKRENIQKEPIPMSTASIQLKRHLKMRYHQKIIDNHYLNDVAYIIICQHPSLKSTLENFLEKEKDYEELGKWKSLPIEKNPFPQYFPFEDKAGDNLYAEKPGYLALPNNVQVKVCLSNEEITEAIMDIKNANKAGFTTVGFDCEWSPFSANQNVSLIQVSLNNTCYIIDACYGNRKLVGEFLEELFSAEHLIKLGIKPKGDIIELLKTFYNVDALYNPTHTLCLTELIRRFNVEDSNHFKMEDSAGKIAGNIDFIVPNWRDFFSEFNIKKNSKDKKDSDNSTNKEKPKIHSDKCDQNEDINELLEEEHHIDDEYTSLDSDILNTTENSTSDTCENEKQAKKEKENLSETNKFDKVITCTGLSRLCKLILGKELEKIEQCSVWDRRPLRISQIRYASLDAESSRMIFLKLEEWGKDLNIDLKKIVFDCSNFTLKKSRFISVEF